LSYLIRSGRVFDEVDDLAAELEALPLHEQLVLRDDRSGIDVVPQDVGVGVSQVIPVVVAALAEGSQLVMIEQPELHIHPAMQVALGDLFIERATSGGSRKTFIIETHSEHLILRLLRRIRETTAGELPPDALPLRPEDVSVIWVEGGQDGTTMKQLEIDETGEFVDRWPRGFFEERAEELF
jgi:predicted ATPase